MTILIKYAYKWNVDNLAQGSVYEYKSKSSYKY